MTNPQRKMELCWQLYEAMDENGFLRNKKRHPLDVHVLAEIMDALAWHPYVNLDPRDGSALLLHLVKRDRRLGKQIRQLAKDALVLAEGDRISAGRAVVAARALRELLAGAAPEALEEMSPGWEITLLAHSWLERGIADADRLREIIAGLPEQSPD